VDGKQKWKSFSRRKDAERFLAGALKATHEGTYQDVKPVLMNVVSLPETSSATNRACGLRSSNLPIGLIANLVLQHSTDVRALYRAWKGEFDERRGARGSLAVVGGYATASPFQIIGTERWDLVGATADLYAARRSYR
jgi:hypothetical protein